ncbi:family 43 glycosylhydrolase [Pedobacter sp. BS3]|uniref:glycoside hydrolase family 43 protein n=1 Tax=Pedobacter sp. BS3 TaxID=2567937 RepID=UPI0011EF142D|nr:glycoside hydrolase family 43 protein [Pedobacter sp. BS3]TZF80798.1 family 43 glycosylhydrolase [Pedobacter sp. BS3]
MIIFKTVFRNLILVCLFFSVDLKGQSLQKDIDHDYIHLADPTIFHHKGMYYLYGTGGSKQTSQGFVVYTSTDLKTWQKPKGVAEGYALKKGDAFGESHFWAPQVFQYKKKFYMAYTADEHIAIAVSDSPLGPFVQSVKQPLLLGNGAKQIDPFVFMDNKGAKYLYYVVVANGANRIYVAELKDDLSGIKEGSVRKCIEADQPWENTWNARWRVTEGPTVVKHKDYYYLFYSANDFRNPDYAVGYAVSKSLLGPWEKVAGNPVISRKNIGHNGTGHGDVLSDDKGQLYYVLHTHFSDEKVSPRLTGIVKVNFVKKRSGPDEFQADTSSFYYLQSGD